MINKELSIMKITEFFDYTFYRFSKGYMRWDGFRADTAIWVLVLIQTMLIIDILSLFYLRLFTIEERMNLREYLIVGVLVLGLMLYFLNYKRYRHKYYFLDERWKNEKRKNKIIKFISILVVIVFLTSFPFIVIYLLNI